MTIIDARTLSGSRYDLVDVRPTEDYLAGHAPGAISAPIDAWERLSKTPGSGLDAGDVWRKEVAALGLGGDAPVAIYDDGRMGGAARSWFILQLNGVETQVVNGGWPAVAEVFAGRIEAGQSARRPAAGAKATPRPARVSLMNRGDVLAQLGGKLQILDARTQGEFDGSERRKNPRGGHLPGARHVPSTTLFDAEGRFKAPAELAEQLRRAGLDKDRPIATHCEGGGRAAVAALAAVHAGFPQVHVYYSGFSDWSRDEACPVEV